MAFTWEQFLMNLVFVLEDYTLKLLPRLLWANEWNPDGDNEKQHGPYQTDVTWYHATLMTL